VVLGIVAVSVLPVLYEIWQVLFTYYVSLFTYLLQVLIIYY